MKKEPYQRPYQIHSQEKSLLKSLNQFGNSSDIAGVLRGNQIHLLLVHVDLLSYLGKIKSGFLNVLFIKMNNENSELS